MSGRKTGATMAPAAGRLAGVGSYRVRIAGRVDESELNAQSPLEMQVDKSDADSTWLSVHTDQSGLIGLMRHLHGLGFVFLSIDREG